MIGTGGRGCKQLRRGSSCQGCKRRWLGGLQGARARVALGGVAAARTGVAHYWPPRPLRMCSKPRGWCGLRASWAGGTGAPGDGCRSGGRRRPPHTTRWGKHPRPARKWFVGDAASAGGSGTKCAWRGCEQRAGWWGRCGPARRSGVCRRARQARTRRAERQGNTQQNDGRTCAAASRRCGVNRCRGERRSYSTRGASQNAAPRVLLAERGPARGEARPEQAACRSVCSRASGQWRAPPVRGSTRKALQSYAPAQASAS